MWIKASYKTKMDNWDLVKLRKKQLVRKDHDHQFLFLQRKTE